MRGFVSPIVVLLAIVAATGFGCKPGDTVGPAAGGNDSGDDGSDTGNDGPDPPSLDHRYTFSISASATDPHVNVGAPATGP